jgi:xylulose-5-phosphate/fructose-6-phosphate phosphoketolase
MVVLNNLDRYQLALDAIGRIPRYSDQVATATARYWETMERHKLFVSEHGEDMPEVQDWRWTSWPDETTQTSAQSITAHSDVALLMN